MASNSSFDIVSEFDQQEMVNTVDQTNREISNRYDLKDTKTTVELEEEVIKISTENDFTLEAIQGILRTKAAKRKLSQKIFDFGQVESASGGRVRQEVKLQRGLSQELAKKISKLIRDNYKKVQASIQGDRVRVSSKSKDSLQEVMQLLKEEDFPVDLQFTNYR